jgi:type IV pilus assembly protein PilE
MTMTVPKHYASARRRARGFTLIELMIVIGVVAILSTIAVSSYRTYVRRANRTEARLILLAVQVAQEKFFLQNNAYAQDMATVTAAPTATPPGLGVGLGAGNVTNGGHYVISFAAATANTYTIQADATGNQTADTAACLKFTINEQGVRTPADSTGCWR